MRGGAQIAAWPGGAPQRAAAPPAMDLRLLREHALVTAWFLITFTRFPHDTQILYALAIYFAWALLRDIRLHLPLLRRAAILFIFPAWCMLSTLWAEDPFTAFRSSLQLFLTMTICFHAVLWLSPRSLLLSVFLATSVVGVLSLLSAASHASGAIGIFAQKNVLGSNMTILWLTSLCLAMNRGFPRYLRLFAIGMAAMAFLLVLESRSATALVLSLSGAGLLGAGMLFVGGGGLMRIDRLGALLLLLGSVGAALTIPAALLRRSPLDILFEALGKDSSITGRTQLWEYAEGVIRQRPWLGVGEGGFWNYWSNPLVRRIFEEYHKMPYHKFSFHNAYYEIAVHQGLIGVGLAMLMLLWAFRRLIGATLSEGGPLNLFFLSFSLLVLIRTWVEADLLKPFVLLHMLIWIGALLVEKRRLAQ